MPLAWTRQLLDERQQEQALALALVRAREQVLLPEQLALHAGTLGA